MTEAFDPYDAMSRSELLVRAKDWRSLAQERTARINQLENDLRAMSVLAAKVDSLLRQLSEILDDLRVS